MDVLVVKVEAVLLFDRVLAQDIAYDLRCLCADWLFIRARFAMSSHSDED